MTTTIELPDSVYDQVKAQAALQGTTVHAFFVEAIREKLADEQIPAVRGWRSVFGKADKEPWQMCSALSTKNSRKSIRKTGNDP